MSSASMIRNYYEFLGLTPQASTEEIKRRLRERKRLWVQRSCAPKLEARQEADRNLSLAGEIEAVLLDPSRRGDYDATLKSGGNPPHTSVHAARGGAHKDIDLIWQGWALIQEGSLPDALFVATKATRIEPENPDAWALLAYAKQKWGDFDGAVSAHKRAIRLRPNEPSYYFDLGSLYEETEKWDEAMTNYRRASLIDPSKPAYRAALAAVLLRGEERAEGIRLLEQCLQEEQGNGKLRFLLAIAYVESAYRGWFYDKKSDGYLPISRRHIEDAEKHLAKAMALGTDDNDVRSAIRDTQAALENGRHRRFFGNPLAVAGSIALAILAFSSADDVSNVWIGIYFLSFGILYALSCMVPQYALNRRILDGKVKTSTDMMFSTFSEDFASGCMTMGVTFVFIIAFLPIMTLWNFANNNGKE